MALVAAVQLGGAVGQLWVEVGLEQRPRLHGPASVEHGLARHGLVTSPCRRANVWTFVHVPVRVKFLGRVGLDVDLDVAVEVGLVTGAVVAHGADERLLPGVSLHVPVQQRFPKEVLVARRPIANVPVPVELLVVDPHVRLPEEGDVAAEVRGGQPLVHRHDVPLQIVTAVRDITAFRIPAAKRFILALLTVRRGQLR